ncbi:glycosyltransferase family 2 protein [Pelagicoccus albus]|uniref:Glycosyltransferase family 2 protein n=1 Tax=Pelagicoccus albus TaxID=415222 RepID=A0A7X1B845_9BACT|nr:glycosyltransferase family 2 protein [Pelagicoccus albus]MBC2607405.1 glycosyltransferase family 2 protein [Pelagicoccus albus]
MKLIIQIPCFNEAETLPGTLADLPRTIPGVDAVEWLVIDDGSADGTADVARNSGVDHVVRLPHNQGLAKAFTTGLEECLKLGADIIVNTDADNQYCGADIAKLVAPVLNGEAEMAIGARPIDGIEEFSPLKKLLQKFGSRVVRSLSGTDVADAPSGFRAMSRSVATKLNVFSEYTYTLETIIQAGQNGMKIVSVPIRVNGKTRESRLVKSIFSYVKRSVLTMCRIFVVYRPMRFFMTLAALTFGVGFIAVLRFLYFYFIGEGSGHVQSVILAVFMMGTGLLLAVVALLADLISVNRRLMERLQWKLTELERGMKTSDLD